MPARENLIAGAIIVLLLMGGGCALSSFSIWLVAESGGVLPFIEESEWCWALVAACGVISLALATLGIIVLRWVRSLASFRIRIGPEGLWTMRHGVATFIKWEDVSKVCEKQTLARKHFHLHGHDVAGLGVSLLASLLVAALPEPKEKSYVLKTKSGEKVGFDENSIKGHTKLAKMIRVETEKRHIPWEVAVVYE